MKPKPQRDFERLLRRFCRKWGLQLVERQPGTSHRSYSIKNRHGRTIATIVIPSGRKEVSPGTLRGILRALGEQLARHSAEDLYETLKRLIAEITKWLQQ